MSGPVEIRGRQPMCVGMRIREMWTTEYWHDGDLAETAYTVHLLIDGSWRKLELEDDAVVWGSGRPVHYVTPDDSGEIRPVDIGGELGIGNGDVEAIRVQRSHGGIEVVFEFAGGLCVTIRRQGGFSNWETA